MTAAPGDPDRIFITEQIGRISVVQDGETKTFLDLRDRVLFALECGALGMTFHPDYEQNGLFYVSYSNQQQNTVLAEIQVSANPDSADASTLRELLLIEQPEEECHHRGGMLEFGPNDGYLYMSVGDGGDRFHADGKPGARHEGHGGPNAQADSLLLGKILRLDVDQGDPYAIPPDNPFLGQPGALPEIWSKGSATRGVSASTRKPATCGSEMSDTSNMRRSTSSPPIAPGEKIMAGTA